MREGGILSVNNEERILEMLGQIMEKLNEHDRRFDEQDKRFDEYEKRFEKLETEMRHTRVLAEAQDHKISLIAEQNCAIMEKLNAMDARIARNDDLRDRVETLEFITKEHAEKLKDLAKAE